MRVCACVFEEERNIEIETGGMRGGVKDEGGVGQKHYHHHIRTQTNTRKQSLFVFSPLSSAISLFSLSYFPIFVVLFDDFVVV